MRRRSSAVNGSGAGNSTLGQVTPSQGSCASTWSIRRASRHMAFRLCEDILDKLEREPALAELGAESEDIARPQLDQGALTECGQHVAAQVTAVVFGLRAAHLGRHLVDDPLLEVARHGGGNREWARIGVLAPSALPLQPARNPPGIWVLARCSAL